mgnify:CR=1 FL=1
MTRTTDPDVAAATLAHYDARAEDFREGTRDHDVSQNIDALLRAIEGPPPFTILDLGCGHGEFINTIRCREKFAMDLNPDSPSFLTNEVTFLPQDCSMRWPHSPRNGRSCSLR